MRVPVRNRGKLSGFTLVEMAIVLVIIGIILAGVMKGRDIVRGSQIKQFAQQFAQKWATVAQTYYDKTGNQLNDGAANGGLAGSPNGMMDGNMHARINTLTTGIVDVLEGVGITPCALIKSRITTQGTAYYGALPAASCATGAAAAQRGVNLCQTLVEGEYAGTCAVTVDLVAISFQPQGATSLNAITRNVILLHNVPTDVCVGLDTAIDGTVSGGSGAFINLSNTGYTPNTAQAVYTAGATFGTLANWPLADTAQSHTAAIVLDY